MVKYAAMLLLAIVFLAPIMGIHEQAWSPWWFQAQNGTTLPVSVDSLPVDTVSLALNPVPNGPQPLVSDAQRFAFALGAGFSFDEAITATAISIAEDGGGDPAAMSPKNNNGTFDLGLWQINSSHWASCGGPAALADPANNAACAHMVYANQGWCAWSTYNARCGAGHTGSYAAYLSRASAAAR